MTTVCAGSSDSMKVWLCVTWIWGVYRKWCEATNMSTQAFSYVVPLFQFNAHTRHLVIDSIQQNHLQKHSTNIMLLLLMRPAILSHIRIWWKRTETEWLFLLNLKRPSKSNKNQNAHSSHRSDLFSLKSICLSTRSKELAADVHLTLVWSSHIMSKY